MNEWLNICRSVADSENAIYRLGKRVGNMTRYCRLTSFRVTCIGIAGICIAAVVAAQDCEIRALKKQVTDLTAKVETLNITEEQKDQEGA